MGSTKDKIGLNINASLVTLCDKLRCIDCDFQVLMIPDSEWHYSVDYLFFRNNMPELMKLKTKCKQKKGSLAYCCQCSWISCSKITLLSLQSKLKWVCGGHS